MSKIKREISVKLQGQEFKIPFPNMGQILDIEIFKANISKGQYAALVATRSQASIMALDFIDAVSTFLVLIPELHSKLNIESLNDLDPIASQELSVQYKHVYFPWYNEIVDAVRLKENEFAKVYNIKDDKS